MLQTVFLVLRCLHSVPTPLVLKIQDKGGKRCPPRNCCSAGTGNLLQRIYLPRSEADGNAAATRHVSEGWAGLGESAAAAVPKQYSLGASPAAAAGVPLAFILGVNEGRLIDLGFFPVPAGCGVGRLSHNPISILKHHEPRRQIYLPLASRTRAA